MDEWPFVLMAFIASAVIWAIGLVVVGLPAWLYLHHRERRHWLWAVAVGAVLTFVAVFVIAMETNFFRGMAGMYVGGGVDPSTLDDAQLASQEWQSAILASSVLSLIGMAVAFVVWRIAYRPEPQPGL
jgi:hypothetical protein